MKRIVQNQTSKRFLWNLQYMGKVIRPFCWHQNFVPWGLSAPALGLYTCIKSWKKWYKIRLLRDFFETCNKWPKWQDVPVDIKISSPRGCQPLPPRLYICIKSWKNCIKSDFKEIVLKLIANERSDKRFLLTSKFCSLGLSAPDLLLYTFIKSWKDVYKVRGWRDSF